MPTADNTDMRRGSLPTVRLAAPGGSVVCERCELALTTVSRLRRMRTHPYETGTGLLTKPATWAHTFFHSQAVDVMFLDRDLRVIRLVAHVAPWRVAACRRASAVVELPAGEAGRRGVRLGLRLVSNPTASV